MSPRFDAFWDEFFKSFTWIGALAERREKLGKLAGLLSLVLPVSLGVAANWVNWLYPWWLFLILPAILYVGWNAGAAWQKTTGPNIHAGRIEADENYLMFDTQIRNSGQSQVIAKVFATDLRDHEGKRIPRIDDEIELHWRGRVIGDKTILFGDKHATAGILQVRKGDEPNTASLLLTLPADPPAWPEEAAGFQVTHLFPPDPIPLANQRQVTLTIRIDFYDLKENFIKSKTKRLVITPDTTSTMCYQVRSV